MARAAGALSGKVFQDYNGNGQLDTGAQGAVDRGIGGVTVSVFDASGASAGQTVSAPNGVWSLSASGSGPYRIEFGALPPGFAFSARSTDSTAGNASTEAGSAVQFVADGATANINLAVNIPSDYCQNNPTLVTCTYWQGRQFADEGPFTPLPVIRQFSAGAGAAAGTTTVPPYDAPASNPNTLSEHVGTVYGLGYNRAANDFWAAAYFKRYAGFGKFGPGAIYQILPSGDKDNVIIVPDAGDDPHAGTSDFISYNPTAFDSVGKTSLGGLDISDSGDVIYVMNLNNRALYAYSPYPGVPSSFAQLAKAAVPLDSANYPTGAGACASDDVRPFAVEYHRGAVYVGVVCSAQSSQNTAQLHAYVWRVNASTLAFEQVVFATPLNYDRGYVANPTLKPAEWLPWIGAFASPTPSTSFPAHPQPMLAGIQFDNDGDMILGLRDRYGDQMGNGRPSGEPATTTTYYGIAAGDTLRACATGLDAAGNATGWTLESAGTCASGKGAGLTPPITPDGGPLYPQGPGAGEFYAADGFYVPTDRLDESYSGGALQIPGYASLATTNYNPIPEGVSDDPSGRESFDVGVRWTSNTTGRLTQAYRLVDGVPGDASFGYANGIGELIAACAAAPIEIGDRVWSDLDGDGVQDANEPGIEGVALALFARDASGAFTVPAGATTTGPNGDYVFAGLAPNTQYEIRATLDGAFLLAPANSASGANADAIDSDAALIDGTARITVQTGGPGANDHSFDIGLIRKLALGNLVWNDIDNNGLRDAGESGVAGVKVELLDAASAVLAETVTNGSGEYAFEGLTPGDYSVRISNLPTGFVSSTGGGYEGANTPDPDDNVDNDDNGDTVAPGVIRSKPISLAAGSEINDGDADPSVNPSLDFGITSQSLSLGDYVWLDLDKDGRQDDDEAGVSGVTVRLYADANGDGTPDGAALAIQTTDAAGKYLFANLVAGNYLVEFVAPNGFALTAKGQGDAAGDSDADPISGRTGVIALNSGALLTIDAGIIGGSIGDYVWRDLNRNGLQDVGESGLAGVIVTLETATGDVLTTTTSISGSYLFNGLASGSYTVTFKLPAGFAFTEPNVGGDDRDSDPDLSNGRVGAITLNPGQDLLTVDAGVVSDVQIVKSSNRPNQSLRRGDVIIYTIDVVNLDDAEIQNVTLTDPVPANTEYVAGSGAPAPSATSPLRWTFTLPARATRRFSFAARVVTVPSGSARIVNKATLTLGNRTIDSNEVVNPLQATAITLNRFEARGGNGGATIQWETAAERNTLGFNLWRAGINDRATAQKITSSPIVATGNGLGAVYRFEDASAPAGAHYWLEEVELSGARTEHGPAVLSPAAAPNTTPAQVSADEVAPVQSIQTVALAPASAAPSTEVGTVAEQRAVAVDAQPIVVAEPAAAVAEAPVSAAVSAPVVQADISAQPPAAASDPVSADVAPVMAAVPNSAAQVAASSSPSEIALARIATVEHTRIALRGGNEPAPLTVASGAEHGAATAAATEPMRTISLEVLMALSLGSATLMALLALGISAVIRRGRPDRVIGA
jgi:uncharacterized repeat protein (TIGR01451 family)